MSAPNLPTAASARQFPVVALVGCPNTGKSTLFNRLTGLHQRVANFPGVTVEGRIGRANLGRRSCEVLDLPGTYSLAATAPDELIVVDALLGRLPGHPRPTVVVLVADAAQLARHLVLAAQVADLGLPLVVAANLCDEARRQGISVALPELSQRLGVPVVPTVASTGEGLPALREAIAAALEQPPAMRLPPWPAMVHEAADRLTAQVQQELGHQLAPAEARRWLFDARPLAARRLAWSPERCAAVLAAAREPIAQAGHHPLAVETQLLRRELESRLAGTVTRQAGAAAARSWTERLDAVLLHPVAGPLILVAILYLVFRSIYSWAGPVMDLIDGLTGNLQGLVAPWLAAWPTLQDLVVTGIIGGVGGVVIFLPQICILFGFIALLESSGYLARAAFLLDRLLGWSGLNGRSLIPMLSSYACAIPGVMAARTIDDPRARLTTILVAPLMSCSARLPVYVLLIGAFVEPRYGATWAALALLAMHGVGLAVALPVAWFANRLVLRTPRLPFLLELPSYRRPVWRDVLHLVASRAGAFLVRAGTIILALSIVIWALLHFPRPAEVEQATQAAQVAELAAATQLPAAQVAEQLAEGTDETAEAWRQQLDQRLAAAYLEQSYLARFGKTIQPLFAPAGYDWKITVGVLGSFPAREVIIATLGIIYGLGDAVDEETPALREQLHAERWAAGPRAGQPVFTVPVALSIMVFFALCMQCGATVATIAREANWRWAVATFAYMTGLAWVGAVLTFQVGTLLLGGG